LGVVAALSAAKRDDPWPEHLQLRDALDELARWLSDDHQWGASRSAPHWQSLIRDVVDGLRDLGPSVQTELAAREAIAEFEQCAAAFELKPAVRDPELRKRLCQCTDTLIERAALPQTLVAAWGDLIAAAHDSDSAAVAARGLLSLATWIGHDSDSFVRRVTQALDGEHGMRVDAELVSPETGTPLEERLTAARTAVAVEPARAHMTVWLRFQLARIRWPPVIAIGDDVRIYRGDWLRSCLCGPKPHHDLPPEATGEDADSVRDFCGVEKAHVEAGGPPHDPNEIPSA
jgi:hypothetical protein